jgi:5-oxoprolinase (ATP-hydrolysing)
MSHCVKYQLAKHGPTLKPGDVILSNSPNSFGSHLPDLTAVTPVFDQGKIIFFTASRAHHADIGGIIAGSMPSNSKMLREEGAEILSFKVVSQGVFDSKGLYKLLVEDPAQYPGCSGCRNYGDVESDLKAVGHPFRRN